MNVRYRSYNPEEGSFLQWQRKAGNPEAGFLYQCKILTKQEVYLYKADFWG